MFLEGFKLSIETVVEDSLPYLEVLLFCFVLFIYFHVTV